jgi:hypothetical protein
MEVAVFVLVLVVLAADRYELQSARYPPRGKLWLLMAFWQVFVAAHVDRAASADPAARMTPRRNVFIMYSFSNELF